MARASGVEDRIVAVIIAAATVGYALGSQELYAIQSDDVVGPAGFPTLIAVVLGALSVWLFLRPQPGEDVEPLGGFAWGYWLIFALYTLAVPVLGFGVGTLLFLASAFYALRITPVRALITSATCTAGLWLIFGKFLGLNLAIGPWG